MFHGTVDTLPRGNDDSGNVKITKTCSANFIPLIYNLTKAAPGKMPKGAGLSPVYNVVITDVLANELAFHAYYTYKM